MMDTGGEKRNIDKMTLLELGERVLPPVLLDFTPLLNEDIKDYVRRTYTPKELVEEDNVVENKA